MEFLDEKKLIDDVMARYESAKNKRRLWEPLWTDCYDYALPQRADTGVVSIRRMEKLYDATALDAVDQLAASLLGHITPPWAPWFGFRAGFEAQPESQEALSVLLEKAARTIQNNLDHSNFLTEMHQCFLDLVVAGTACLSIEETPPGSLSAFTFCAIPLSTLVLEESDTGRIDTIYRTLTLNLKGLVARFGEMDIKGDADKNFTVIEQISSNHHGAHYLAILTEGADRPLLLVEKNLASSPFIAFRWTKSAGEVYGRSPVMNVLPDVKVANKVVELILKNASIAVTGIWQADDDGVLNPATIELVPGAIIPKAVGSQGLKPLEMPGRFDISQIVLDNLRARIRHALLVDRLSALDGNKMTATEVLERSSEMTRLLGATYGRLSSELLLPLIGRLWSILRGRGAIPDLPLDSRLIEIEDRAPLAIAQRATHIQGLLGWVQATQSFGPQVQALIDYPAIARHLADALGLPKLFFKPQGEDHAN